MANQGELPGLISPGFKAKRDTSANRSIAGMWSALDARAIVVHQERCAKVRNRNVACLKCAEACTSGCISLVEGKLVVDPLQCVGCGTCATVCPTSALEAHNPTDAELLSECAATLRCKPADQAAEIAIGCQPVRDALAGLVAEGALVPVVCAGRIDESLLLGLAAQGVEAVHIVCGNCDQCAQKYGLDTAQLVAETTRTLLDNWNMSTKVTVGDNVPADVLTTGVTAEQAEEAIAAFFSELRSCRPIATSASDSIDGVVAQKEASFGHSEGMTQGEVERGDTACSADSSYESENADLGSTQVNNTVAHDDGVPYGLLRVMKDGTLPHFISDRRERLLDALACLPEPEVNTVLKTRLWGTVTINSQKCSSCRLCATFCPTGAIRKFDLENGEFGIDHTPADCVNCGSCRDICPEEAIDLQEVVTMYDLLEGTYVRHRMIPRAVSLRNNPHQIVDTFRQTFNGDIFER